MPELPEIETIKLQLSKLIIGKKIENVRVLNDKSFIGEKDLVIGGKVTSIRRYAKILVIDLSLGLSLAVHLKMSGQLIYKQTTKNNNKNRIKHTRVIIEFEDGDRLNFNDMRKFGWMKLVKNSKLKIQNYNSKIQRLEEIIDNLGPDALNDLTEEKFREILKSSSRPVKLVLMDQEKIAGVGNIYVSEALFLSGIHPKTSSNKIPNRKTKDLLTNLKKVLEMGIKKGGASSNLYRDAYGGKGKVQKFLNVYNREGKACPKKCGSKITKFKLGGRGTYFCPKCQKIIE